MMRINCKLDEESVTICVLKGDDVIGTKVIKGEIGGQDTVSFSNNAFAYSTEQLSLFINDVRANIPSSFSFDESAEEIDDGFFDGIFYMQSKIIFCTSYGINCTKSYIHMFDNNRDLIIADLYAMQKVLNAYAINLLERYHQICLVDEDEADEPKDELNIKEINKSNEPEENSTKVKN